MRATASAARKLCCSPARAPVVNDIGVDADGQLAAEQVVEEIRRAGGEAVANTESVASLEGGQRIVDAVLDAFGRVDILINNAGIYRTEDVDRVSEELWDRFMAVHLKGTFATIKFATPIFKRQRAGVIVNTSSEAGLGRPGDVHYASAKEGIIGLTRSVARELGRFGIRCNAIRPRAADTQMVAESRAGLERWRPLTEALGRYSLGEMGHAYRGELKAAMVAPLVVWLCTDAATNVNGRTFLAGGDEIGLWSEPQLVRSLSRAGGWDLDALDDLARDGLTFDLENHFLLEDSLGAREL